MTHHGFIRNYGQSSDKLFTRTRQQVNCASVWNTLLKFLRSTQFTVTLKLVLNCTSLEIHLLTPTLHDAISLYLMDGFQWCHKYSSLEWTTRHCCKGFRTNSMVKVANRPIAL